VNRDLKWTLAALAATLSALVLALANLGSSIGHADGPPVAAIVAALLLCGLTYGSVVYLVARWGCLRRQDDTRGVASTCPDRLYTTRKVPHVCVLVPSYKEEPRVVRQTVISAALAEYPSRRIVVLIDDNPTAVGADAEALAAMQHAMRTLHLQFRHAAQGLKAERAAFLARSNRGRTIDVAQEARRLARLYEQHAAWVEALAERGGDAAFAHVDRFFNEQIVGRAADLHRERADRLSDGGRVDATRILIEYRRLALLLDVEIDTFERKRYVNLPHAPSKAMNLNAYIGLLGRSFKVAPTRDGPLLQACTSGEADLAVPCADFLLTLDADSVVRHDYLHKLASILLADKRIAVAQTPYSTYPDAPTMLERAAGAQTDLQYLVHQGLSFFRAAYWVGANALLRVDALRDIRRVKRERGHEVPVFIQDKTVIEDTGSSLDLVRRGWKLHNHPERLAYSATPPDFGALIIQRRRWANGGLIILADLLRYARRPRGKRPGVTELAMRAHYLCSPTLSSLGVLVLALLPVQGELASPWLPLTALPYFLMYGWDLKRCGYGWRDWLRVYALNLMLLPINLAGVLRSLRQIITGRKSSFGRTPKVGNRTSAPARHVALQFGLLAATVAAALWALLTSHGWLGTFCVFNTACLLYGLVRFVGVREAWQDLTAVVPPRGGATHAAPVGGGALVPASVLEHADFATQTALPR
jgi:cellulose synthase/poly-beta-1,6-N-acetylglucosamine synthase-like glycosyltransferase